MVRREWVWGGRDVWREKILFPVTRTLPLDVKGWNEMKPKCEERKQSQGSVVWQVVQSVTQSGRTDYRRMQWAFWCPNVLTMMSIHAVIAKQHGPHQQLPSTQTQIDSLFGPYASAGHADVPTSPRCQFPLLLLVNMMCFRVPCQAWVREWLGERIEVSAGNECNHERYEEFVPVLTFGHAVQDHVNQTIGTGSTSSIAVYVCSQWVEGWFSRATMMCEEVKERKGESKWLAINMSGMRW